MAASATAPPQRRYGLEAWFDFALIAAFTFAAALIASYATAPAIPTWYAGLEKPSWTPPNAAFPAVWSVLYFLMAFAAWLAWRAAGWRRARVALALFLVQLALNALWSVLFFGLHRPGVALVEIALLFAAIAVTARAFWALSRAGALLLLPYLLWVGLALTLNAGIVWLNS